LGKKIPKSQIPKMKSGREGLRKEVFVPHARGAVEIAVQAPKAEFNRQLWDIEKDVILRRKRDKGLREYKKRRRKGCEDWNRGGAAIQGSS